MLLPTIITGCIAAAATATPLTPRQSASVTAARPSLLGNPDAQHNPPANASLVASLLAADSTVTRFRRLQEAVGNGTTSFKFDYSPAANPNQTPGQGGEVVVSNRVVFPMVTNLGISGAVFFFAPCGLNTPHTHPRGSEIFTVATNNTFNVGFVLENGLTQEVNTTLTQYQGTAFPMSSIHWQQNMDCEPAVAMGALSSEDPGTSSIVPNLLVNTNSDIVQAAIANPKQITPENFAAWKDYIAPSFVRGLRDCYNRCGLEY